MGLPDRQRFFVRSGASLMPIGVFLLQRILGQSVGETEFCII